VPELVDDVLVSADEYTMDRYWETQALDLACLSPARNRRPEVHRLGA
jgi:hypothetical protein